MFRCSHTLFRGRIIRACYSYYLLKQSVVLQQCVINLVMMWLHILVVSLLMCVYMLHCLEVN